MKFVKLFGTKIRAKDVTFKNGRNLDNCKAWTYVDYTAGSEKTINVDVSSWDECLIVVGVNGTDDTNRRVLASTVISRDMFAIGYSYQSGGRHQACYNGTYQGGINFVSKNQIKLFATPSALTRLYYR